jgi:outer membrane protein TolC
MKLTIRFNQKIKILFIVINVMTFDLIGQDIDFWYCLDQAKALSPIKRSEQYLQNIDQLQSSLDQTGYYPMIRVTGSATYQSDVFALPFSPPGVEVPEIPKDQYNIFLEINQSIYDGGFTKAQKRNSTATNSLKASELEVALYQINDLISSIYFNMLFLERKRSIQDVLLEELENQQKRSETGLKQGILLNSDVQRIQKELIKVQNEIAATQLSYETLHDMLEQWVGPAEQGQYVLQDPEVQYGRDQNIERPELHVFESRSLLLETNMEMARETRRPRLVGFARTGLGQPNPLNFFETDFDAYYLIGARLEWQPWDWRKSSKQISMLQLNQEIVAAQRDQFIRTIEQDRINQLGQLEVLKNQIQTDEQILEIQQEIFLESERRYAAGTLSTTDYLSELNIKNQNELTLELHRLELIHAQIRIMTLTGNLP